MGTMSFRLYLPRLINEILFQAIVEPEVQLNGAEEGIAVPRD